MVGELLLLLHNVLLQVDKADNWLWTLETCRAYTVRSAYRIITIYPPLVNLVPVADLWHKDVPLRWFFSLGGYFETGCPQKKIYIIVVSWIGILYCVRQDVIWLNPLITYSYTVIFLVLSGISYIGGSEFLQSYLLRCRLIFSI